MIIKRIELMNWGPYRGKHAVDLSNDIYGVIGVHTKDRGRSNWLGKSWFLAAIRFALYGVRPDNTINDDSWISDNREGGGVILKLNDGSVISRSRRRGKTTQLVAIIDGKESTQKRAQANINTHVGMTHADFVASHFIRQKEISRLISIRPLERTEIANNWFRLSKLQISVDIQKDKLNKLLEKSSNLSSEKNAIVNEQQLINCSRIRKDIKSQEVEIRKYKKEIDRLDKKMDGLKEWMEHSVKADEYDQIVKEGKKLSKELKGAKFDIDRYNKLKDRATKAELRYNKDEEAYLSLKALHSGDVEFDGQCPIICDECPVADDIRSAVLTVDEQLELAEQAVDISQEKYEKINRRLSKYNQYKSKSDRMDVLRDRVIELSPSHLYIQRHGKPEDLTHLKNLYQDYVSKRSESEKSIASLKSELEKYDRYQKRIKELENQTKQLDKTIKLHNEAIMIFGRNGVQKVIAESALNEIELDANTALINMGIDLSIKVTWYRPGSGVASHCMNCGHPFPKSRKIKYCEKCNTIRGSKIVQELDIIPSDRSGAADDIAGLVFQLSAAKWLRTDRGTDWSVIFIDEPFGALDKTNSSLLSNHIHSIIRNDYSFNQGFVIAHDSAIMSSLPSIIKVIGSDVGSRLEVIDG